MKKLFSLLLTLVLLVVALVAGVGLYLTLFFDPNDYKDQMAQAVAEQTGRTLTIDGDVSLSLFPWVAVEIGQVRLGNAPGFSEPVFAGAETVRVSVKLLPLLRQEVEMDTVTLHGLTVNLARDATGRGNWEDLARPKDEPAGVPEDGPGAGAPPLAALAVGGVDVRDAVLRWHDAQAGQKLALEGLDLATGAIVAGQPVDLDLAFSVKGEQPPLDGDVKLTTELVLDLAAQRYQARDLALAVALRGDHLPASPLDLDLEAQVSADLQAGTVAVDGLRLAALGATASGAANAEGILGEPRYRATLKLAEFSPREVMERLGLAPPVTTDPGVLARASLSTRVEGSAKGVAMKDLNVQFDDTVVAGEVAVVDFAAPAYRFDLDLDAIDVDRYLPPPAPAEPGTAPATAPPPAGAGANAALLPLAPLRALDAEGTVRIDRLKVNNLKLSDILIRLTGKDGVVRLDPVDARLYDGLFKGQFTVNARQDTPMMKVKKALAGVQAGPLLKDLTGEEPISGTAQFNADLTLRGSDPAAIKQSLSGNLDFAFMEGAVKGVNIGRMIREARARLQGQTLPPDKEETQTDFSELTGTVTLRNGLARNDDLSVKSPLLRVTGKGQAHLAEETVDYTLTTVVVGSLKGQGGEELEDLKGVPIPIKVTGSFAAPKFGLDLEEILKQKAVKDVKEKASGELKKKLEEKLKGSGASDLLKGLLR